VIDLPTLQRYLNFHFSVTIDLFGADESSNAATFYSTGPEGPLRGRQAQRRPPAARPELQGASTLVDGKLVQKEVLDAQRCSTKCCATTTSRTAMGGVGRWYKVIEKAGIPSGLVTPHRPSTATSARLAGVKVSPKRWCERAEWNAREDQWLPERADRAFVEPDGAASSSRASSPTGSRRGPGHQPPAGDVEYVRFAWNGGAGGSQASTGLHRTPSSCKQHLIDPEICIRCNTCEVDPARSCDSRTTATTTVVDASKCNLAWLHLAMSHGSIDNWRTDAEAKAYSVEEETVRIGSPCARGAQRGRAGEAAGSALAGPTPGRALHAASNRRGPSRSAARGARAAWSARMPHQPVRPKAAQDLAATVRAMSASRRSARSTTRHTSC
jgi:hypothetical protein